MSHEIQDPDAPVGVAAHERSVSARTMELVVAGALMALAAVIMWDSWRIGARWGDDGPGAGYFPFRVGVILFAVSAATFFTKLRDASAAGVPFVERAQLSLVLQVFVPTLVFVALIPFLGIYVAGAIFIAYFMIRLGSYGAHVAAPVALGVPAALFVLFEVWFLVPLPKGPLEAAFGY
jgi:putative tricarboxylic transport membrane protein